MRLSTNSVQRPTLRHASEDGRDYLVAPVVAVVAGVLNGELLPADELRAQAWEGKPVTLGHPRRGQEYVSAQDEAALVLGTLRNMAKGEDHRLTGEIWLDVGRVAALGGEAVFTLAAMAAGKALEVSTGYWCQVEGAVGKHNGRDYNGVQRGLEPDHLAILLHEEGACNWADGCGTPRVNQACGCQCQREEQTMQDVQNQVEEVVEATPVEVAPVIEEMAAQEAPALLVEDEPVVNAQAETQVEEQAETPAQEPIPTEVGEVAALIAELGGVGAVKEALTLLRANRDAARETLVAELAANQACAFSRADLEGMNAEHLQKLAQSLRTPSYAGRGGVRANMQDEWVVYQTPVPAAK